MKQLMVVAVVAAGMCGDSEAAKSHVGNAAVRDATAASEFPRDCRVKSVVKLEEGNQYKGQLVCKTSFDGSQGGIGLAYDAFDLVPFTAVHDGTDTVVELGEAVDAEQQAFEALKSAGE